MIRSARRWHLWAALIAGVPLVLQAMSGAALALRVPALELWAEEIAEGARLDPVRLEARVREAMPEARLEAVFWDEEATRPAQVRLVTPEGERTWLIDPATGERLPRAEAVEGVYRAVLDFHMHLLLGEWGTGVVRLSCWLVIVLGVSGVILALPKRREAAWEPLWPRRRTAWLWHRAVGLWVTPCLAVFAVTGLSWTSEWFQAAAHGVTGSRPRLEAPVVAAGGGAAAPLAAFWETAQAHARGEGSARLVGVGQVEKPVRFEWQPEASPVGSLRSVLFMDPRTAEALRVDHVEDLDRAPRWLRYAYPLHIGSIAGGPGQAVMGMAALGVVFLAWTGWRLYRRRSRKDLR